MSGSTQGDLPGIAPAGEAPPILPSSGTRPAEALALLLKNGSLDQRQFLDDANGWRLAAAVHRLRSLGWPVRTERVPVYCSNGHASTIARYRLDREALRKHQAGGIWPELAAWLAFASAALALPFAGRWPI